MYSNDESEFTPEQEARAAANVRNAKLGDRIRVVDADGHWFLHDGQTLTIALVPVEYSRGAGSRLTDRDGDFWAVPDDGDPDDPAPKLCLSPFRFDIITQEG